MLNPFMHNLFIDHYTSIYFICSGCIMYLMTTKTQSPNQKGTNEMKYQISYGLVDAVNIHDCIHDYT
jgi:hypothetical protein